MARVNADRLVRRIETLGDIGRRDDGLLSRVALTVEDREARNQLVEWMEALDLEVEIDGIGNIFGTWGRSRGPGSEPVMIGSHIDTVVDAGIYDGAYGVLAGLEIIEALRATGASPGRPITVAAFTNEEGIRYAPDMMGSVVHVGGLSLEAALQTRGTDDSLLGDELERIGYRGPMEPGAIRPYAFLELHVEQGPVLEHRRLPVAAVDGVQGISWQKITIEGESNHAGTTPMRLRRDAGLAASRITAFLPALAERTGPATVATAGRLELEPNVVNVVPGRAVMTVDLRDPDEGRISAAEDRLTKHLAELEAGLDVRIRTEQLVRFRPVRFDPGLVGRIEAAARERGHAPCRLTSGAGHDAQMMARVAPSAMIFVPSRGGVSHSPDEYTAPEALAAGADVLLDVVSELAEAR